MHDAFQQLNVVLSRHLTVLENFNIHVRIRQFEAPRQPFQRLPTQQWSDVSRAFDLLFTDMGPPIPPHDVFDNKAWLKHFFILTLFFIEQVNPLLPSSFDCSFTFPFCFPTDNSPIY